MSVAYTHLRLSDRKAIEKGLKNKMTVPTIAKQLGRPPITIRREILRNRDRRPDHHTRKMRNDCKHRNECQLGRLCSTTCIGPMEACRYCDRCNDVCEQFVMDTCERRDKEVGCCNGCERTQNCHMRRWLYYADKAQAKTTQRLTESRTGITLTEDEIALIDEIVTPGVLRGQSLHSIIVANRDRIPCSERTLYTIVKTGRIQAKTIDLPLAVRRRPREKSVYHKVDKGCRIGRSFMDYLEWQEGAGHIEAVQMDTVEGKKGQRKVMLTLYWPAAKLLLIHLLERKTSAAVTEVLVSFHQQLGKKRFQSLFPAILTDRGTEFSNPTAKEGCSRQVVIYRNC